MQSGAARLLVALAAGAVLSLALPPLGLWPLIFISVPVAAMLLQRRSTTIIGAAFEGWAFGFGYFTAALHWIGFAFLVDASTYLWMMPFAVGGLAAFLALYWAAAFAVSRFLKRFGIPVVASLPLALAVTELGRGFFFTGFPWAAPGLIADGMGGALQLASLIGMPGLTYWVLLWGLLPWLLWSLLRRQQQLATPRRAARVVLALVLLSLLPLGWLWGDNRLAASPRQDVPGVSLLLVQPNVSQSDKWRSDNAAAMFDQLVGLSTEGEAAKGATHVIWPESSLPFLIEENSAGLARIGDALLPGQSLIAGAIRREKAGAPGGDRYFTSILSIDDKGVVVNHYDKWRLVPGGEFLPLAWLLEPLGFRKVVSLPESFTPGQGPSSINFGAAGAAGLLVCYEIIFPDRLVNPLHRPDWLVNVTNDGWFGNSVGPYQHLAQARMRAVEQNLPVARAANTGVSAIIDGVGRYVARSDLDVATALRGALPKAGAATPFSRFGVLLSILASLIPALILVLGFSSRE